MKSNVICVVTSRFSKLIGSDGVVLEEFMVNTITSRCNGGERKFKVVIMDELFARRKLSIPKIVHIITNLRAIHPFSTVIRNALVNPLSSYFFSGLIHWNSLFRA